MKKVLLLLTIFSLSFNSMVKNSYAEGEAAPGANAAPAVVNHTDVIALQRSYLQLRQQKIVLDNLQLTPQESETFWPIFRKYQNDFEPLGDRLVALILTFNEKFESMTDDEATQMLKEAQDIQQAENDLKRSYVEQFSQVLSPKKVLRFYQIDNKIRTEIRYNLSLEIPLLEVEEEPQSA